MTDKEINELLERYKADKCSPEERAWVEGWYLQMEANSFDPSPDYESIQQEIWTKINKKPLRYWPAAAAAILILLTGLLYFLYNKDKKPVDIYAYNQAHDIPAGSNKATLTLANGQQIVLDEAKAGTIAQQAGVNITKNAAGQIVYNASLQGGALPDEYNTITTPNGGQYEVILPDGSHVYLNAASSLKYPVKFNTGERKVELSGEGYFEITKNPGQPFIVHTINQTVKVLGTHFNVSSYPGEPLKTTLAEGKVLVNLHVQNIPSVTLQPGEQAINTGESLAIKMVNVADQIAWKDGLFVFNQSSIKDVLRQICRWYNVQVDYSTLPDKSFDGEISRDFPLSELLKAIEKTNHVKFKIEGKQITLIK